MSNYVKSTNFAAKDALLTGNPNKVVKGTEIDTEFNSIVSAVASKADLNSPALTGVPTAPTAIQGTSTTQLATTAFVRTEIDALDLGTMSAQDADDVAITGGTITGITDLAVADGGTGQSTYTNGQLLIGNTAGGLSKNTLTAGTGMSITNGDGAITVTCTVVGNPGTVTSVDTGNGLSGGAITSSGTIVLAAPGSNTIGSYAFVLGLGGNIPTYSYAFGSNYTAGAGGGQLGIAHLYLSGGVLTVGGSYGNITGTWKWLGAGITGLASGENVVGIAVRVA
jgi:hypothetical protein